MKKSLKVLTITMLLVVVMLFTLTGCSNAPYHLFLNAKWDKQATEIATYDYKYQKNDEVKNTGTLVTTFKQITDKTEKIIIGEEEFTNEDNGNIFTYDLTINDSSDHIYAEVYFKGYSDRPFVPVASFIKRVEGQKTTELKLNYFSREFKAEYTLNGEKTEFTNKLNKNALIFDNIQLFAIARTFDFKQKQPTLTFNTPIVVENNVEVKPYGLRMVQSLKVNAPEGENLPPKDKTFINMNGGKEFVAMNVALTRNEYPIGTPIQIIVANSETLQVGSNKNNTFKQPILEITESNKEQGLSTYILKDMVKA